MAKYGTSSTATPRLRFPEFRKTRPWPFTKIDDLLEETARPIEMDDDETYSLVTVKRRYGGVVARERLLGQAIKVKSQYAVKTDDFLISKRQIVHDACGVVPSELEGAIVSNEYSVLRAKDGVDIRFFDYFAHQPDVSESFLTSSVGIVIEKMLFKLKTWLRYEFPFPSSHAEQQKIADCLTSLDEVIAAQGQKVTALAAHKRGLMQRLLPQEGETLPRLRFPEFRGKADWTIHVLDEYVAKSFYGTSSSTSEKGRYRVLRMGNMTDGRLDTTNLVYLDLDEDAFESFRLERGDILLNRTNSPDLVGKISIFLLEGDWLTASYIVAYRLDQKQLHPVFCNAMLNTQMYQAKIKQLSRPSVSQANINPTTFRKELLITVPSLAEQQRIAASLSALDAQIAAESAKRDALKTHKQALMQQLFPSTDAAGMGD